VYLSQDNWQSRAFQFYVGDLHEVIGSTKNVSSYVEMTGKCQAINDKNFNLEMKTVSSYAVKVNFTCFLEQNGTKLVDIVLPVEYEITPTLTSRELNFVIKNIKGTPTFV
jgi:cytochrome c oxidase assembly protein Cox11